MMEHVVAAQRLSQRSTIDTLFSKEDTRTSKGLRISRKLHQTALVSMVPPSRDLFRSLSSDSVGSPKLGRKKPKGSSVASMNPLFAGQSNIVKRRPSQSSVSSESSSTDDDREYDIDEYAASQRYQAEMQRQHPNKGGDVSPSSTVALDVDLDADATNTQQPSDRHQTQPIHRKQSSPTTAATAIIPNLQPATPLAETTRGDDHPASQLQQHASNNQAKPARAPRPAQGIPIHLKKLSMSHLEAQVFIIPGASGIANLRTVASNTLGIQAKRFFYSNGEEVVCLDDMKANQVLFVSDGRNFYNIHNQNRRASSVAETSPVCPVHMRKGDPLVMSVLGASGVGKTSLVMQYVCKSFVPIKEATIEDTYRKRVCLDKETSELTIVDTAGQDEFAMLRSDWMSRADGYLFVYSMTNKESMDALKSFYKIHQSLAEERDEAIPIILVANNKDIVDANAAQLKTPRQEALAMANEMGAPHIEVSALTGEMVDHVFAELIKKMRANKKEQLVESPPQRKKTSMHRPSFINLLKKGDSRGSNKGSDIATARAPSRPKDPVRTGKKRRGNSGGKCVIS